MKNTLLLSLVVLIGLVSCKPKDAATEEATTQTADTTMAAPPKAYYHALIVKALKPSWCLTQITPTYYEPPTSAKRIWQLQRKREP